MTAPRSILVVRRDNIGDLICTTPLLAALRSRFPTAWIAVYANSYNAPILAGNPNVDEVVAYRKAKHHRETNRFMLLTERIGELLALRRRRLDWVVLATPADQPRMRQLARLLGPKHVAGFTNARTTHSLDYAVPLDSVRHLHEVEAVFRLAGAFGIDGMPPALSITVDPREQARVTAALAAAGLAGVHPLVGVHVSARKPSQRWPTERFIELMHALHGQTRAAFVLFWSPGPADHPQHPGDDEKARQVADGTRGLPVLAWPTDALSSLVAGLAVCDRLVCSDGGAMHIAAALRKPIVCLFGNSDPGRWRPWGVPHEVLQPVSRDVTDVNVDEVLAAYERLSARA